MEIIQGSRKLETGILLTLAGGYLDAYTYAVRGGVFANAQTGNIIKLGLRIAEGRFQECLNLLIPICAFSIGILFTLLTERWMKKRDLHYIRRTALAMEIIALSCVALIPVSPDTHIIANTLVSFACAIQMEAFPVFNGQIIATTVSTGNLRKALGFLFKAAADHDKEKLRTAMIYFMIVFLFISGVIMGSLISVRFGRLSVLVPVLMMVIAEAVITIKSRY